MGFSRQECWSGLPCPPLGDLPDAKIETVSLMSPALEVGSSPLAPAGKPHLLLFHCFETLRGDFGIQRALLGAT